MGINVPFLDIPDEDLICQQGYRCVGITVVLLLMRCAPTATTRARSTHSKANTIPRRECSCFISTDPSTIREKQSIHWEWKRTKGRKPRRKGGHTPPTDPGDTLADVLSFFLTLSLPLRFLLPGCIIQPIDPLPTPPHTPHAQRTDFALITTTTTTITTTTPPPPPRPLDVTGGLTTQA
jgi:hypothetical protein